MPRSSSTSSAKALAAATGLGWQQKFICRTFEQKLKRRLLYPPTHPFGPLAERHSDQCDTPRYELRRWLYDRTRIFKTHLSPTPANVAALESLQGPLLLLTREPSEAVLSYCSSNMTLRRDGALRRELASLLCSLEAWRAGWAAANLSVQHISYAQLERDGRDVVYARAAPPQCVELRGAAAAARGVRGTVSCRHAARARGGRAAAVRESHRSGEGGAQLCAIEVAE